jgi:hypothetical protein
MPEPAVAFVPPVDFEHRTDPHGSADLRSAKAPWIRARLRLDLGPRHASRQLLDVVVQPSLSRLDSLGENRMQHSRFRSVAVLSLLAALLTGCDSTERWVSADVYECTSFGQVKDGQAAKCATMAATGVFVITINKAANSCAILFQSIREDGQQWTDKTHLLYKGQSFAYVGENNWLCVGDPAPLTIGPVAEMSRGHLKIRSVDRGPYGGSVDYEITQPSWNIRDWVHR